MDDLAGAMNRLKKLRRLSAGEVASVVRHKASRACGQSTQWLRVCLVRGVWPGFGVKRVSELCGNIQFFGLEEWRRQKGRLKVCLEEQVGITQEQIERVADQYCNHVFDLLGSGAVCLGNKIEWNRDFKAGIAWPKIYFERIQEIKLNDSSDIKVPWELSRCYHFVSLGMAYWFTQNEKYAREYAQQCWDWLAENPPYHGVNWRCAMEVAIRAINWIWGYYLFQESPQLNAELRSRIASSLAIHGEYIWNNLEFDKRVIGGHYLRHNGNHYISDLVGLVYLGITLPGRQAERWLNWGLQELEREMQVQVLSDGVHWELSPSYHRLVLELVLPVVILCTRNGVAVPENLRLACERMAEYTMHYLKPDGRSPLVRDADDGRVYLLEEREHQDHRPLLALAGAFLGREDFMRRAARVSGDVVWLLGPSGVEHALRLTGPVSELGSKGFPQGGFYVLRNGDELHVFVTCADIGMAGTYGGHAHNDCLSFELFYRGVTYITDSGTYNYSGDPAGRNAFRSTASHNTARIDLAEINRFIDTQLFGMENDACPKVLEWQTSAERDSLRAEHYGYTRLSRPVTHRRSFLLDRAAHSLVITDEFSGSGEHLFEVFYHFSPEVQVEAVSLRCFQIRGPSSCISLEFAGQDSWAARLEPGWVSKSYGRKEPASQLVLTSRQSVPAQLVATFALGQTAAKPELEGDGEFRRANARQASLAR